MPRINKFFPKKKEEEVDMEDVLEEVEEESEEEASNKTTTSNRDQQSGEVQLVTENQLLNAKLDHIINFLESRR
jgi:hypothetical protein